MNLWWDSPLVQQWVANGEVCAPIHLAPFDGFHPMPCERCGDPRIVGMWSHDGLPGHEILVCNACWNWLTEDAEVRL